MSDKHRDPSSEPQEQANNPDWEKDKSSPQKEMPGSDDDTD